MTDTSPQPKPWDGFDYGPTGPLAPLFDRLADGYPDYMMTPPYGWVDLVLQLDRDLSQVVPDYTIAQVKSKFAGLRYYIDSYNTDDEVALENAKHLILLAERESCTICEFCGQPGEVDVSKTWLATACGTCMEAGR